MTEPRVQDLLRKINLIEADLQIQRQILVSIPSKQTKDIEDCIRTIAEKQNEIKDLRKEIQRIDPVQHQRIVRFEEATIAFRDLAKERNFTKINGQNDQGLCSLTLVNGQTIDCLVIACDALGDWAAIDHNGTIREFSAKEVAASTMAEDEAFDELVPGPGN